MLRVPEREKFLGKFEKGTKLEREERLFEHLKVLYSTSRDEKSRCFGGAAGREDLEQSGFIAMSGEVFQRRAGLGEP